MRYLPILAFITSVSAFAATDTRSTTLIVNVGPACAVAIVSSPYTVDPVKNTASGQILFRYAIRTSHAGGSGAINLRPLDPGRTITFSTRLAGIGAASGEQTVSSGETAVAGTFGADAHTLTTNESGTISWTGSGSSAPQFNLTISCQ